MDKYSGRVRLRFWVEQDLQLLKEVAKQNPFENVDKWRVIHENFVNECNIPFSLRTCKDHCIHLLNLYEENKLKIRPKETRPEFAKKLKYLEEISNLKNQFSMNQFSFFCDTLGTQNTIQNKSTGSGKTNLKEEDDNDDFYWKDDDDQISTDNETNLDKRELAIQERKLALREQQIKLKEEKCELYKMEASRRMEMANIERTVFHNVTKQNEMIISALLKKLTKNNNSNLCVL